MWLVVVVVPVVVVVVVVVHDSEALALEEMGWKPAKQGKGWREGPGSRHVVLIVKMRGRDQRVEVGGGGEKGVVVEEWVGGVGCSAG